MFTTNQKILRLGCWSRCIIFRRTWVMAWYHLYTDITSPPFSSLISFFSSFKRKRFESFNTKRIMQLHLKCHSRKSRYKFVVQLRRMLLVRVFFNGHKNMPHANESGWPDLREKLWKRLYDFLSNEPLKADLWPENSRNCFEMHKIAALRSVNDDTRWKVAFA